MCLAVVLLNIGHPGPVFHPRKKENQDTPELRPNDLPQNEAEPK